MNPTFNKQKLQRLLQSNQIKKARDVCNKLCKLTPDDFEVWLINASIHAQLGALDKVAKCCEKAIKLQPNNAMTRYNLGIAYNSMGNFELAEKSFRKTLLLDPDMQVANIALGQVLMKRARLEEAETLYNNLLNGQALHNPEFVLQANINLSLALYEQKKFFEAEKACKKALAINPNSAESLNNLGQILKEQGSLKGAADAHRRAIKIQPEFVIAHSNLLLDLNYLTDLDASEVLAEHYQWGLLHSPTSLLKQYSVKGRDPDKCLRIGYVSPDFRAHSVILFIAGLIEAHNRNNFEVFCYSNVKNPDSWTTRVSEAADHWREVDTIDDVQLAAIIKEDKIDILVDLAGHTANNRLLAFARKPAPIQVTWLGYPNTTGMSAIDYRFTDEWADPPGVSDELNTETLVRLPHGFLCFQPLHDSPPINDLPMLQRGDITFGCFNNSAKINSDVISLWSRLLQKLPESRLILKSQQLSDPALKQRYLSEFECAGVNPKRIQIYGRLASTNDHLSLYHQVDVALDPFPYNGTTTTCEALWMGIPVVVLEGNNHAGRVGTSLLNNVGLPELIAQTGDDYVRICSELAEDPKRLTELRMAMRTRLQNAPLLDTGKFAQSIEDAYRNMWVSYCKN